MYFNGSALGVSYLDGNSTTALTPTYDCIKLYGNQKINYVRVKNTILSDDELDTMEYNDVPSWDDDTTFLAMFDNTLEAGSYKGLSDTITGLNIQRRDGTNVSTTDLVTIDVNNNTYEDLYAGANKHYMFTVSPVTNSIIGAPIISNYVDTVFYNWSLTDLDSNQVFLFNINIKSDTYETQEDRTVYPTFTKYPKISRGKRNYIQGGLSALYNPTGDYSQMESVEYVETLKNIVTNGKTKILKDRKGNVYMVDTYNFTSSQLEDDIAQQPVQISFKFVQIEDTPS